MVWHHDLLKKISERQSIPISLIYLMIIEDWIFKISAGYK